MLCLKKNSPSIGGWKHNCVLSFLDANQQIPSISGTCPWANGDYFQTKKNKIGGGNDIRHHCQGNLQFAGLFFRFHMSMSWKNGNLSFQQEMSMSHWLNRRISASWCWPWKSSCKTWVPKYSTTFVSFTQNEWLLYIPPPPTRCLFLTRCFYIFW